MNPDTLTRPRPARAAALLAACLLAGQARGQDAPPPPPADPSAALLDRLRQMEESNKRLLEKFDALDKQNQGLAKQNKELSKKVEDLSQKVKKADDREADRKKADDKDKASTSDDKSRADAEGGERGGRSGTSGGPQGRAGGVDRPAAGQEVGNRHLGKLKLNSAYNYDRDGFQWTTEDDEYQLKIRAMVQADARIYQQANSEPTNGGFYLPRTRFYFSGRLTKPIEYQLSFQRGFSSFDVLNAYINFHYDDRLQVRVGRFKTPYTYEFYKIHNWQLMAPERSLFNVNFQGNRQVGLMGWGEVFDKRLEYAVGVFDGPRKSYNDFNNSPDIIAFLNARPWEATDSFLRNLNVGGSVDFGNQNNPLNPAVLRTNAQESTSSESSTSSTTNAASVPFLAFNDNVRERGDRALWELHLAYFYEGLSLLAAWDGGFADYARTGAGNRPVHLPIGGWFAQAGYILTGETLNERTLIDPLRPFDLRHGKFGPGAWEITARYSEVNLGNQVFTAGLADPNLWTNRAQMVDVGLNWYLNKFVKIYFDWEHAMFAQPVLYAPGPLLQKTSDLFWFRFQVYF